MKWFKNWPKIKVKRVKTWIKIKRNGLTKMSTGESFKVFT